MSKLTTNKKRTTYILNDIMIDGITVKMQRCEIEKDKPENMTLTNWVVNKDLYRDNRELVREAESKFEDECYAEQATYTNS